MDTDTSAPGELSLVESFLNTLDERSYRLHGQRRSGGDALAEPGSLAAWLVGQGFVPPRTTASQRDLAAALDLRSALREGLSRRARRQPGTGRDQAAGHEVPGNAALARFPLLVQLAPDGTLGLEPAACTAPGGEHVLRALGRLTVAVARASADGTWDRMRMCGAPDCRWVFYDDSRNGAGRWCSMAVCGNRDKTRRYRDRRVGSHGRRR